MQINRDFYSADMIILTALFSHYPHNNFDVVEECYHCSDSLSDLPNFPCDLEIDLDLPPHPGVIVIQTLTCTVVPLPSDNIVLLLWRLAPLTEFLPLLSRQ